jgi:hypothetical protein
LARYRVYEAFDIVWLVGFWQEQRMQNEWHPWKDRKRARPADSILLKIEFAILLALVSAGLLASLLSAIGAI